MHFAHQCSAHALADPTEDRFDLAAIKFKGWGRWIGLITSIAAELWLRMAREREIRRMRKAWTTIDDRTLRDIGFSRWEWRMRELGKLRI